LTQSRSLFGWTLVVTLAIKIWLALFFPMTGDEAFFHEWANFPNWGYYDHPPMVGWLLWGLTQISHEPWVIRSFTVCLTSILGFGIVMLARELLPSEHEDKAWLAGAVYLSLPVSWYFVFVTTDTPLVFFMGLSIYTYVRALRRESVAGVLLAGAFLGLAFLSKYFAVLLGFAMGWHILWQRKRWAYAVALMAGVLPFAAVNVVYNAYNCWNNIMFNLVNRHEDAQLGYKTVATYVGMMIYLITPWAAWSLLKNTKQLAGAFQSRGALLALILVPLFLFLIISLKKTVGLHWVLGFLPIAFVMLAFTAKAATLKKFVWANAALSIPHLIVFALLSHGDANIWTKKGFPEDVNFHRNTPEIIVGLTVDMPAEAVLTTIAYSPAALLSYHYGKVVPVFGPGKYHARNDDVFVDWRQMAGKPIRVVSKEKPFEMEKYTPYLSDIAVTQKTVGGVPFYVLDGRNFNYELFRDVVLKEAAQRYYKIPSILPVLDCPFARKYEFEDLCRIAPLAQSIQVGN
jgi:hypothetical protein